MPELARDRISRERGNRLLNVEETAQALGISVRMVWRLIARGELARVSIGRCCRISAWSLEDFIARGGSR
jgi:excisionase family DNA binding protein